ncbi:MAG: chemotaxis protein CheW [Armatimonadetes bacterium]|nr:chemotaxis protein CheW [Armatimonadota bacterium]MCX7968663.1 chemotaxis protein CheW [Armatimonadota bacterium]MDW8143403.1 chemotaxis protein CheW [Armatimonadota bacterium]
MVKVADEKQEQERHIVVFRLNGTLFALDIQSVQEIVKQSDIVSVPGAPPFILGIVNLRGRIMAVVDTKRLLGIGETSADKVLVMVAQIGEHLVGFTVDEVEQVTRITSDMVEPVSDLVSPEEARRLEGVLKLDGKLVLLLDANRLLDEEVVSASLAQS